MCHLRTLAALTCVAIAAACGGTEPSNAPPIAAFSAHCDRLACVFENASTDDDGTIAAYAWNFGDGATSTDPSPAHSYALPGGDFTVSVMVTDNQGGAATLSRKLLVRTDSVTSTDSLPPANHSPVAAFSVNCVELTCTFTDRSTDPDAGDSLVSRAWHFGDADSSTGRNPIHTYGAPGGRFMVTLTVTDRGGATATATEQEDVHAPAPDILPPQTGQIAFSRDGKIYRVNVDGSALIQLSAGPADSEPAWSPDGGSIAFSRGGQAGGIYVMSADGGDPVRRAIAGGSPTWSPDGQWVGFACRADLEGAVCKVRANDDGAAPVTVVVRRGYLAYPAWSPDGTRIAFSSDWNMFDYWLDLWQASLDGSPFTMILGSANLNPGFDRVQPAWSPDGQRIAVGTCPYGFTVCGSGAVAILNADGSGLAQIAGTTGLPHPTWSPDGHFIAFASGGSIEWVAVDGRQRGPIVANGSGPAWRPGL